MTSTLTIRLTSASTLYNVLFNGQGNVYQARVKSIAAQGVTDEDVVLDFSFLSRHHFSFGENFYRGILYPIKESLGAGNVPPGLQYTVLDMPWEECVIGNRETVSLTLDDLSSAVTAGTQVYVTLEYKLASM